MIENMEKYKRECREFLSDFALNALRSYGRMIGVNNPTKDKKKNVLIDEIVAVLSGEVMPTLPSRLGAPVKNDFVDPKLPEGLEQIRIANLKGGSQEEIVARMRALQKNPYVLSVADPNADELKRRGLNEIFNGQLETVNGISMLLPLDCSDADVKIVVSVEMIRAYDLREGDVISCLAERRQNLLVAVKILKINGFSADNYHRAKFDECRVRYPYQRVKFCEKEETASLVAKLLQWLVVVGKGQRGLVVAPPKTGKTTLLTDIALCAKQADENTCVISLLVDQAPEAIRLYRELVGSENLLFTTYEDTPEYQMFVAEFALKRAKRYAESGKDVLLVVDSFNALSRAFNDTDESVGGKTLPGGLESKTLQYLKRYFGTARCFERGGSLTMIGTLSVDTGNPADDYLRAELSAVSNLEIVLSEELAKKRIYPAIDLLDTRGKRTADSTGMYEGVTNEIIRGEYLEKFTVKDLYKIVMDAVSFSDMETQIFKQLKAKKK